MTALVSYSTGTVSVAAGGTVVTGVGSLWSGVNVRPGDIFQIGNFQTVVSDVTDVTHLVIPPWGGGTQSAVAYTIFQVSPQRFAGSQAMADVSALIAALNTSGFYVFVDVALTAPDPSLGNNGQYAFQGTTGKLWQKSGGIWVFLGIYKGFGIPLPWNSATTYTAFDVASLAGTSYVCILSNTNQTPPNATYWTVLASIGATGPTGAGGASGTNAPTYGGTSTTSLTIGTGSKAFTTQVGLAYLNGARVRASSTANTSNWMEGLVAYSGTTLTITVDKTNGSGTIASWNFNLVGQPGAGDLSSANNLSDVASPSVALINLGLPAIMRSYLAGLNLSTAGSSSTFGIAVGAATNSTNVDFLSLGSAFTKGTATWAVGSGNGALDTGTIANATWYHVFLIKRPDTGVVDILISLSPTTPTLPTNYTLFRRIGSMKTNGSAQWIKFTQIGDEFLLDVAVSDVNNSTAVTTTNTVFTLGSIPTGISVLAFLRIAFVNSAAGSACLISSTLGSVQMANSPAGNSNVFSSAANAFQDTETRIWTNTSAQVNASSSQAANNSIYIVSYGWADRRGRDL